MKSVSTIWGVLFVAVGLGAAAFVALAPVRTTRIAGFERSLEASAEQFRVAALGAGLDGLAEAGPDIVEGPVPSIGKSPRVRTVHYHYGDNRLHGPFAVARVWFPFTLFALSACALIGFVRTRAARAEK